MDERVPNLEKLAESLAPVPAEMGRLAERTTAGEGRLDSLESQIVQLRADMKAEFSAVRGAMTGMKGELRGEMAAMKTELREDIAAQGREMAAGFLKVDGELRGLHLKLDRLLLKGL
jgi:hypothetical protein